MTAPSNVQAAALPAPEPRGELVEGPQQTVILQAAHKDPMPSPSSSTDEDCESSEFTGTPSQVSQSSESSKENENTQKSEKTPENVQIQP